MTGERSRGALPWIAALALAALALADALLVSQARGLFPFRPDVLRIARSEAETVAKHYEAAGRAAGVLGAPAYANGLARMSAEARAAKSAADVATVTQRWGVYLGSLMAESRHTSAVTRILELLRKDAALPASRGGILSLAPGEEADRIAILDPSQLLSTSARSAIEKDRVAAGLTHRLELEAAHGTVATASADALAARLKSLEGERAAVAARLQSAEADAGYAEMEGPGVMVKVFDAKGKGDEAFVHDADIRNIVNELAAAGAKGIEVSGARLRSRSAIRCVGPVLQVDGAPVAVSPVLIKAVGDSEVLARSLEIVRRALSEYNLKLTIEKKWVWISAAKR